MDAFDADVLIYAAVPDHTLGRRVLALLPSQPVAVAAERTGVGSVLLLPEVLSKPLREGSDSELSALGAILARLDLRIVDDATAQLAVALAARYQLRAADAVHLATAIAVGADRFLTNNHRDFPKGITEIAVTYPDELPDPAPPAEGAGRSEH